LYYHVIVENDEKLGKSTNYKQYFELDKTETESILKDIIIPFLMNKEIHFDGYFLKRNEIKRIAIKKTEKTSKELSDYKNKNMTRGIIMYISPQDVVQYETISEDVTKELFEKANTNLKENDSIIENDTIKTFNDPREIFIVHGQDDLAKLEIARFIETIGFKPIILHEQASSGKTIIEKIEEYTNVKFGIVLYTPCDIGAKNDKKPLLKPRARQNVVFEHGFLIGKLGRSNVSAIVKESVEIPNDISGVVYTSMDTQGGWKISIARELKKSGYLVDMNKVV
jgi:predicted nucleotide-binding protein